MDRYLENNLKETLDTLEDKVEERTKELRLAHDYNRNLIETALDPLVTIGPDGTITDVNKATEKVTGYLREELVGTDFADYFTEPDKAKKGYKQVFQYGLVRDYPLEIRHKNGTLTPVLYNVSIYRDGYGEVVGVFAAARDITDVKKQKKNSGNTGKIWKKRLNFALKNLQNLTLTWNSLFMLLHMTLGNL